MGTIAFLLARQIWGGAAPDDYQWLGLLISLDSIACVQFLRWWKSRK